MCDAAASALGQLSHVLTDSNSSRRAAVELGYGALATYRRAVTTLSTLRTQVEESYERLGLPSWPNPHAGKDSPREEEYSRVTDPARYRIVHTRARLWADRLSAVRRISAEQLTSASFDRGVRLTSTRRGTLPLLLLERGVPLSGRGAPRATLQISVARPEVSVEILPDCGCDACDYGSADLLKAVDDTIVEVIGSPFVALRGNGWHVEWYQDGGSASIGADGPEYYQMMELCRRLAGGEDVRLPAGAEALLGNAWFD
jgi:hypothetical protein